MLETCNDKATICTSGCQNGWFDYYGEPVACAECNDDCKKEKSRINLNER